MTLLCIHQKERGKGKFKSKDHYKTNHIRQKQLKLKTQSQVVIYVIAKE